MTLREVLHVHIPCLTEESTVRDAIDKMDVYQFPALVVVDDQMAPIGVLTEGDICRAVTLKGSLAELGGEPAVIHASKDPATASPDAEIGDALHKMLSSGLTLLPIVEDDRLAGVVLRVDLMQAMLLDLAEDAGETQ
ncbi:MAG: CBS domain-containing protein [Fimbriimonas ginsengisoli]|uniref:CBS domain-containing protein n=1 Tax=Fimbriimonas ginsengisoli TaxID=1005039 RepID=A0A931PV35_FIMGI|nr:CBS domain-containing protein [Fimbriimonas ginsengisoli]